MNSALKQSFMIVSVTVISAFSTLGSATAVTVPRPDLSKGCICGGRYFPMRICMVMRCADSANSFTTSDRRPLNHSLGNTEQSPISAEENSLIAGRYQTRGPGAGIGRSADV